MNHRGNDDERCWFSKGCEVALMPRKQIVRWIALLVVCVGVASFLNRALAQQGTPSGRPSVAATCGRYQVVINPNVRADTFLLDTETGKTWVATSFTDVEGEPTVWLFRDRIDNQQEMADWITRQTVKQPVK